jgi:hypothetical protein
MKKLLAGVIYVLSCGVFLIIAGVICLSTCLFPTEGLMQALSRHDKKSY